MSLFGIKEEDFSELIGEVVKLSDKEGKDFQEIKDAILSLGSRITALEKWSNDTQKYMEANNKVLTAFQEDVTNEDDEIHNVKTDISEILKILKNKTSGDNEDEEEEPKRDKYFATKGHCDNCDKKVTLEKPFEEFTTNKGRKNKLRGRCSECGEEVEIEI